MKSAGIWILMKIQDKPMTQDSNWPPASWNQAQSDYDSSIRYSHASLRYIDSIISDKHGFKGDWLEFIQDNLNITVKNQYNTRGKVLNVQLNQAFELNNNSRLQISVSNGQSDKKENLLVWEIGIHRTGSFTNESLMTWLLESHEITSDVFKDIVNDTLYERFR